MPVNGTSSLILSKAQPTTGEINDAYDRANEILTKWPIGDGVRLLTSVVVVQHLGLMLRGCPPETASGLLHGLHASAGRVFQEAIGGWRDLNHTLTDSRYREQLYHAIRRGQGL